MSGLQESQLNEFRDLAKRHRITYRVDPAVEFAGDERVIIGYDVELIGAHPAHADVLPGCSACQRVWDDLDRISTTLRERLEGRASVTRALPFRPELVTSKGPDGKDRDQVQLTLAVRHRAGYFEPVDHCEQTCRDDIVEFLRSIGARAAGTP